MKKEVKLIGEVDFKDVKVKIYHDPYSNKEFIGCTWQMRNPESCYEGIVYMNWDTGKITYPEDAIIPEQNDRDKEMLPKFVIAGVEIVDDKFISFLMPYLNTEYIKRNK